MWLGRRARSLSAAGLLATAAACAKHDAPDALVGRWTSEDPRYAGRTLEIRFDAVEIGIEGMPPEVYALRSVESERSPDGGTRHELLAREPDGTEQSFRLELLPGAPPRMRFENHDELWVRDAAPAPARRENG